MTNRTQARYIAAIFFILCGLIIGIVGSYYCIIPKYYKGTIPLATSIYPNNMLATQPVLHYNFTDTKLWDLPYTTDKKFLWFTIPIGLAYTILGIATILKEDLIFRKD